MNLGDSAPDFSLKGADEKTYSLASFKDENVLIVVFSCNHCPYVQAYESRMIDIQRDYLDRGVRLVAINANDSRNYPEDGFEEMKKRSKEKNLNFPYLHDESQETARRYGATHTPHLFVFDSQRKLAYTGKIDDNWQDPAAVRRRYLREALDDLLSGKSPATPETHAIGCTIKWKK
ncbi:MAG: thioredoxin family protein [Elusimicrobia bacterium]|nr:thioredoxin family protein [Elusimicrobiota bacterium]